MGKITKYIRKRFKKGFTFLVVPNSSENVKSYAIPFSLALLICGIIIFNLYIFIGFSTQVWQIYRFRTAISEKDLRIDKLESEQREVTPTLQHSYQIAEELNRLKEERARLLSTWKDVKQKGGNFFTQVSRGGRMMKTGYKMAPLPKDVPVRTSLGELQNNLSQISSFLDEESKEQSQLLKELIAYEHLLDHTPSIWPVTSVVTSWFGFRVHPSFRIYQKHHGIDLQAQYGTKVRAAADGVVKYTGYRGGYGYAVIIQHGYGYETLYAHNSEILVYEGQNVKKGQVITLSGNSGTSTGPHLHYEVHINGVPVNPKRFLR